MRCFVYKSLRKAETYLYLDRRDDFSQLPAGLRDLLGELRLVIDFDLQASRRLPRENAAAILRDLETRGYHLQLPEVRDPPRNPH